MWRAAIYASALLLFGMSTAWAQDACPRGARVRQLELMLEDNQRRAELAARHGQNAIARTSFDEATRLAEELPYAYLDQEIASFPLFRNSRCMLRAYSIIVGQTVLAEQRPDGAWTLYTQEGDQARVVRDRMTDQQLLDLVRSVNR